MLHPVKIPQIFRTVLNCYCPHNVLICAYFSLDLDEITFSLEEAHLWTEDSHFSQKHQFELKNVLMIDLFLTNTHLFTSQDGNWWTRVMWITCGLLWCFYQLSFWRHPFNAEDPLAQLLQICSDEENKLSYILDDLSTFSAFFIIIILPLINFFFFIRYNFHSIFRDTCQNFISLTKQWDRLTQHTLNINIEQSLLI